METTTIDERTQALEVAVRRYLALRWEYTEAAYAAEDHFRALLEQNGEHYYDADLGTAFFIGRGGQIKNAEVTE